MFFFLVVLFHDNLKMDSHVHFLISECSQRMYILKLLQHRGMPPDKRRDVAYSLIVSRIVYALPAWGGFMSAELLTRLMQCSGV